MARSRRSPDEAVAFLRHLTHLGAMSIVARQQWRANWTPVQRIIQAVQEPLLLESERLHGLLQRSNALLTPIG